VTAQIVRLPNASSYLSIGTYSMSHVDIMSASSNQASLMQLKNVSAGVFSERRFLLEELSLYRASLAIPTKSGTFGINTGYFGGAEYRESQLALAYSRKLGSKVDIAVQFNYNNFQVPTYGNADAINVELGAIFHLSEKIHTGIHMANPAGGKIGKNENEKLASVYKTGFGYEASEKLLINAEIIKQEDQPVNITAGMQYKLLPQILFRAGISSASTSGFAGVGLTLSNLRLDLMSSFHQQLGVTPGLMVLFNFNNKKD
jgi:hypothetical protein